MSHTYLNICFVTFSFVSREGGKGAAEALVAVAAMVGKGGAALSRRFGPSSPTIGYLGQIEVVPVVNPAVDFFVMNDPSCLPRSNTCARRLYLPKYNSYDSFVMVLRLVVRK